MFNSYKNLAPILDMIPCQVIELKTIGIGREEEEEEVCAKVYIFFPSAWILVAFNIY